MSNYIHLSAVVSPDAALGNNIHIGPYCVVEDGTSIGDGCVLASHVVLKRGTHLGTNNEICEGAVLGGRPQHIKGELICGGLRIGEANRIRENATIHCALREGQNTTVGDRNLIMVNAHIAHDCQIGNHTIIVNNAMLAGHVTIEDRAYISGAVGVHQFCRIGQLAMVGGQAHIAQDVPPFVMVDGATTRIVGLNRVGLRRNGYTEEQILQLKEAYRLIYRSGLTWTEVAQELADKFTSGPAACYLPFLTSGKRGFVSERRLPRAATIRMPSSDDRDFIENEFRRAG